MKRAHRNAHRLMWPALAAAMAVALICGVMLRPGEPVNETLPDYLPAAQDTTGEAR